MRAPFCNFKFLRLRLAILKRLGVSLHIWAFFAANAANNRSLAAHSVRLPVLLAESLPSLSAALSRPAAQPQNYLSLWAFAQTPNSLREFLLDH